MKILKIAPIATALVLSTSVNAAPISITVNGTINSAWGGMEESVGDTVTATFMFDLDGTAASHVDNDDSDNPLEAFSAIYTFGDGSYSWSAFSNIDPEPVGSSYVSVLTADNYSDPVDTGGVSVDVIDIWGSAVSGICPQPQRKSDRISFAVQGSGYVTDTKFPRKDSIINQENDVVGFVQCR